MEWSYCLSYRHCLFYLFGRSQRFVRHDSEIGIQSRVERLDAVEAGLNEFYRRELARPNQADNVSNAQPREISDGHMEQPTLSSLKLGVDEFDDFLKGLCGSW